MHICTSDAFTDCPTRERVQWLQDLYVHNRVAAFAFGDTAMTRRALFAGAQSQLDDGRINGFYPSERSNCAFASSTLMWLHILADLWLHSGDEAGIRQLLPTARRVIECLQSLTDASGLITRWPAGQFWDWAPVEGEGCLLATNAAYILALKRLHSIEAFRQELGTDLAARADKVAAAAHKTFFLRDRGWYSDRRLDDGSLSPVYSQLAVALAVLAGIVPADQRAELLRRLIDPANLAPVSAGEASLKPENRGKSDRIVPVGTLAAGHWLVTALFEAGLDTAAVGQLRFLWGAYPDLPTFPETRIQHGNTGHCHGWAGGPAFLLPMYVLGLSPTGPGWRTARFAPRPADVTRTAGTLATPAGPLHAAWDRAGDGWHLTLDVPRGVTVQVDFHDCHEAVPGPARWAALVQDT